MSPRKCVIAFTFTLLVFATTAVAAEETAEKISLNYFQRFVVDGGIITWLVLIPLSVITLALVLGHGLSTRPSQLMDAELFDQIAAALRQGDAKTAWHLAEQDEDFLSSVVRRGLSELPTGQQTAEYAVIEASEEQASKLFSQIEYLNIIGNVAPMIGLVGTVYGIILAFNTLADVVRQGGVTRPDQLAEGISIALVNTFWGLIIAVPALAMYGLFRNRIDATAGKIAANVIDLLKSVKPGVVEELKSLTTSKAKEQD